MEWSLVTKARDPVEKCPFEFKAMVITEPKPVCPAAYSPGGRQIKVPGLICVPGPSLVPALETQTQKSPLTQTWVSFPRLRSATLGLPLGIQILLSRGGDLNDSNNYLSLFLTLRLLSEGVCVCGYTHVWKSSDSLLELVVAPTMWILEIEQRSSNLATNAFTHRAISPVFCCVLFCCF